MTMNITTLNQLVEHLEKLAKEGRDILDRMDANSIHGHVLLAANPYRDNSPNKKMICTERNDGWPLDDNYNAAFNPNRLPESFCVFLIQVPVYQNQKEFRKSDNFLYAGYISMEQQKSLMQSQPILTEEEIEKMNKPWNK